MECCLDSVKLALYGTCFAWLEALPPCSAFSFSRFKTELLHKDCVGSHNCQSTVGMLTDPEMKVW